MFTRHYVKKLAAVLCLSLFLLPVKGASASGPRAIITETGMELVRLPGGQFIMGDERGGRDEKPRRVYLSPFYIGKFEVTQEQFEMVLGKNQSRVRGRRNPVEQVTWAGAARFANKLSFLEGLQPVYCEKTWEADFEADGFRLPTEAEWEFAARAGTRTRFSFGDDLRKLSVFAWSEENAAGRHRPVGRKLPNPWGLHDMHGNISEWVHDYFCSRTAYYQYHQEAPVKNPRGPKTGKFRVVRGGSFTSPADELRSSFRSFQKPAYADICLAGYDIYGFRLARNAE